MTVVAVCVAGAGAGAGVTVVSVGVAGAGAGAGVAAVAVGFAGAFVLVFKGVPSYNVRPPLFTRHADRCLVLRFSNIGDSGLCRWPPGVRIVCDFEDSNVAFSWVRGEWF